MTRQHFFHTIGWWCLLFLLFLSSAHCSKEYSYEGAPQNDTTSLVDTIATSSIIIPSCVSCINTTTPKPNTWMFTVNGTLVCGNVTRALRNAAGTALTFFGPSQCSPDTGLVVTAYFPTPGLSSNSTRYIAERVGLDYYDKLTPSSIAVAPVTTEFSLVIESYNVQSGDATGTFEGLALMVNGDVIKIANGKFNIKIE